jgi:hypothetical protein
MPPSARLLFMIDVSNIPHVLSMAIPRIPTKYMDH